RDAIKEGGEMLESERLLYRAHALDAFGWRQCRQCTQLAELVRRTRSPGDDVESLPRALHRHVMAGEAEEEVVRQQVRAGHEERDARGDEPDGVPRKPAPMAFV